MSRAGLPVLQDRCDPPARLGTHLSYSMVAVAALEPHFAARLAEVAGIKAAKPGQDLMLLLPSTRTKLTDFFAGLTRKQIDALATAHDLPLMTMA